MAVELNIARRTSKDEPLQAKVFLWLSYKGREVVCGRLKKRVKLWESYFEKGEVSGIKALGRAGKLDF